jgi:hypothetical protein
MTLAVHEPDTADAAPCSKLKLRRGRPLTVNTERRVSHSSLGRPVVFYGASYLAAWKVENLAAIPVVYSAVGGLQTGELVEQFAGVVPRVQPRAVMFWGFNDFLRASRDTIEAAFDRACENHRALVCKARTFRIEPVLMTAPTLLPPRGALEAIRACVGGLRRKQSYQQVINDRVVRLNAFLRALAVREQILLLDVQELLSQRHGRRVAAFRRPDGNHISVAGYDALTSYVAPRLAAHFGDRGSRTRTAAESLDHVAVR